MKKSHSIGNHSRSVFDIFCVRAHVMGAVMRLKTSWSSRNETAISMY